ncbi:hypothetical protein CHGG_00408 [Chaetomium globosum CBS 148.51]|uniref:Protein-lysine N-methyltransferase EFM5 n=1 Tax=Chaetomium globosum (strain ATCC 6205 / CBS 148.51 / DSM 1962 / NBRC 6347 / NRRL 1970) TaxID=306901 RepID=Q2HH96_CHAGB|nr:uncharacterized protein CHGG_00408 [Chaetomium globosum CBS 148.51]EAQ92173.1 hypothetical protein CHGG_00408 [Chaetomium globosum CBS 148.51]
MTNHESDDDGLSLPASTLDALKEFYAERDARAEEFKKLKVQAEAIHAAIDKVEVEVKPLSMDAFTEDWNESQFWYADETAELYAKLMLEGATSDMTVAVVSTPSVFMAVKNILNAAPPEQPKPKVVLLEHDRRFNIFPEFVYYDFAEPLKLPGTCDRIICDPPFLSEDCQTKAALTVRWLARPLSPNTDQEQPQQQQQQQPRLIVCTGERMEDVVTRVYRAFGLRTTDYEPVHARGLGNEFYCYANFESSSWGWRKRV